MSLDLSDDLECQAGAIMLSLGIKYSMRGVYFAMYGAVVLRVKPSPTRNYDEKKFISLKSVFSLHIPENQ